MARKLSPGVHTIRIKKPGGGTRAQRVNVLKSGKFKFIKNVKGGAKPKVGKKAAKPRGKARRTSPKKQGGTPRMARKKSSLPNRIINAGLLALAFIPAINLMLTLPFARLGDELANLYTAGLSRGTFKKELAMQAGGPILASFILFEVKKMAMKKFRF